MTIHKPNRNDLDTLLARGRLSGPDRDRILAGALRSAANNRPWWQRWAVAWWAPSLVGAATVLFLVLPKPASDGFRSKGAVKNPAAPLLEVGCGNGDAMRCPSGGTLVFRVAGASGGGFLSAFAQAIGSNERIWYFPNSGGTSPRVAPQRDPQTLTQGVHLGLEQPPGDYLIHLVLGREPITRDQAIAGTGPNVVTATTVRFTIVP